MHAVTQSSPAEIAAAALRLRGGELVAFPTETVYGLGADAKNEQAIAKLFTAKGRPASHPVIVHLLSAIQLTDWAENPPPLAWRLAEHFWPGPLTLVLRRLPHVSDAVTGGQNTVGLRVPRHPVAQGLLRAFGGGIAAPSANRFGRVSPTLAEHVLAEFPDADFPILRGGACEVGLESTIVDLSGERPTLLRPGGITRAMLAEVAGVPMADPSSISPRASGTLASHYAPQSPLRLIEENQLAAAVADCTAQQITPAVIASPLILESLPPATFHPVPWPGDARARGAALYQVLRQADAAKAGIIFLAAVDFSAPPGGFEEAIVDRLRRAAHQE